MADNVPHPVHSQTLSRRVFVVLTRTMNVNVNFQPEIDSAARQYGIDPKLLAAVAAQETGGPGSNSGRNIVGDGGHGHGIFQIDDRYHAFANTAAAMDPARNAQYAARMIANNLRQYDGNVHAALSAYNAGDPHAVGTKTTWSDGKTLGYADSVMRHYQQLGGEARANHASTSANVNTLSQFSRLFTPIQQPPSHCPKAPTNSFQSLDNYITGDDSQ
jgi:hypothetical protein